jgi:flagellar protein FlaJ
MLKAFSVFCYEYVGSHALKLVPYLEHLNSEFDKAGIDISLPEYISMMIVSSTLTFLFSFILLGPLFMLSQGIMGLIPTISVSIIFSTMSVLSLYFYPNIKKASRASKMKDTLPFATMYLTTMAGTGTPLPEIFKNLGETEEYGEVSKEAQKIYRDINTFGMNASKALRESAARSPNEDYEDLMRGMTHTLNTGGSLRTFLDMRSEELMEKYKRRVQEFSENLSLLVEMYITLIVVGSIIFISMSAIMSTLSQDISPSQIVLIQLITIFGGLPLISFMFILLVDGLEPGGIR